MKLRPTLIAATLLLCILPPALCAAPTFDLPPDLFPIVTWDRQDAWSSGFQTVADCHFTVGGFVKPEDLPACEKLGLMAIVAPGDPAKPWFRDWKKLTDEEIDRTIKSAVERSQNSKAVLGYAIMDEPGVPAFPKLAVAVAAVKKYAPGKLAHINLLPSYATLGAPDTSQLGAATYKEYVEKYIAEVHPQFLCYDNYMVEFSDDLQDAPKAAIYYANLLEIRRIAQEHSLPFWNVVSCNQIRKTTPIPSPANLAFQAYTTLAAGGRGITWFKYHQGAYAYAPIDTAGRKTPTWQYLQPVNQQIQTLAPILNRLTSTGVFCNSPIADKSAPQLPGRIVKQLASKASLKAAHKSEPPVMIGEFSDDKGVDYVMLVNLSLARSTNVKFQTVKSYKSRQIISASDGALSPLDEQEGYWLAAGSGVLIRLE